MFHRIEEAFEIMRERNRRYLKGDDPEAKTSEEAQTSAPVDEPAADLTPEEKAEAFHREEEKVELEKGDLPAMIISAFLVFGPIILVLVGIVALAWFLLQ